MSIHQSAAALSGPNLVRAPAEHRETLAMRIGHGLQDYFRTRREYRQLQEAPHWVLDDVGLTRQQVRDAMRRHRFGLLSDRTLSGLR